MSKEAMKQALEQALEMLNDNREYIEANERSEYLAMYDKAIAGAEKALAEQPDHIEDVLAMAEQPAQQEPDKLLHIGERDCLLDVDEEAWRSLVENRGGCRCHISPPCGACSNPISEKEMNEVGYTYTTPQPPAQPLADEVRVPLEVLEAAESSLGSFCSDEGWSDQDMQNMDNLSAYIARHKAAHGMTKGGAA